MKTAQELVDWANAFYDRIDHYRYDPEQHLPTGLTRDELHHAQVAGYNMDELLALKERVLEETKYLVNGDPTKDNIKKALEEYQMKHGVDGDFRETQALILEVVDEIERDVYHLRYLSYPEQLTWEEYERQYTDFLDNPSDVDEFARLNRERAKEKKESIAAKPLLEASIKRSYDRPQPLWEHARWHPTLRALEVFFLNVLPYAVNAFKLQYMIEHFLELAEYNALSQEQREAIDKQKEAEAKRIAAEDKHDYKMYSHFGQFGDGTPIPVATPEEAMIDGLHAQIDDLTQESYKYRSLYQELQHKLSDVNLSAEQKVAEANRLMQASEEKNAFYSDKLDTIQSKYNRRSEDIEAYWQTLGKREPVQGYKKGVRWLNSLTFPHSTELHLKDYGRNPQHAAQMLALRAGIVSDSNVFLVKLMNRGANNQNQVIVEIEHQGETKPAQITVEECNKGRKMISTCLTPYDEIWRDVEKDFFRDEGVPLHLHPETPAWFLGKHNEIKKEVQRRLDLRKKKGQRN